MTGYVVGTNIDAANVGIACQNGDILRHGFRPACRFEPPRNPLLDCLEWQELAGDLPVELDNMKAEAAFNRLAPQFTLRHAFKRALEFRNGRTRRQLAEIAAMLARRAD